LQLDSKIEKFTSLSPGQGTFVPAPMITRKEKNKMLLFYV